MKRHPHRPPAPPPGKVAPIKENREYLKVYKRGRSQVHPLIVTYALKNRLGYTRLGITTSKKIGKAVQRNRACRLIKTAYHNLLPEIAPGYDIVVVARTKATFSKEQMVERALRSQLKKAGVLP